MRTTIPLLVAFVAAPALLLAGFAGAEHAAEAPTAAVLDARLASSADLYYDLEPLAVGESFAVAYQTGADVVRVRSERTEGGYAVSLVPGALRPSAVTVHYLSDGEPVAPSVTVDGAADVFAGTSAEGPDSYHWVCDADGCRIFQDYKKETGIADGSAPFRTAAGEAVTVTDVAFELHGLALDAPETVRFETPADVRLTAQSFGPTRR